MNIINKLIKAIKNPKKAFSIIRYNIFKIIGNNDFKRFIVLSRSRTGSNMLLEFLNSHPRIYIQGEIFSKLNGRNYKNVLNSVFSKQPYYIKATGFKIFYYHPLDDDDSNLWNDLIKMKELYVIHLKRRNILRTLISRKIAGNTNVYGQYKLSKNIYKTKKEKIVEFSKNELENGFKQTRKWENDGDEKFNKHSFITIYYEDLVKNFEYEFKRITNFLDLRYIKPKNKLKKQNPEKTHSILANYKKLKDSFKGTNWQSFFED
mgnify:CR=1 FL=1